MTCTQIESNDVMERYVLGRLSEEESVAFEAHYFDCPSCLEGLQRMQTLQAELGRGRIGNRNSVSGWRIWALAAAALILASLVVWNLSRPHQGAVIETKAPQKASALELLAKFGPPAYQEPVLRGTTKPSELAFRDAMKIYARGDYAGARAGLEAASRADATAPGPLFYLGICQLAGEQAGDAVATLARVTALGDSPYLEPARFYRAKAFLRMGDAAGAREELVAVAALKGDREAEAKRMLAELASPEGAK